MKHRAFTLIELLVTMGLMIVIMTSLAGMYNSARSSLQYGANRLDIQGASRETIARIALLAVTAGPSSGKIQTTPLTQGALVSPVAAGTPQSFLTFYTPDDFLAPELSVPPNTNRAKYWDPTQTSRLPVFLYRIRHDAPTRLLLLEKLDPASGSVLASRVLAGKSGSGSNAPRLTNVTFTRLENASVRVQIRMQATVRGDDGRPRDVNHTLESALLFPALKY
ncbi:MAG: hypothetical protein AMXMBFR33_32590 [Candidatus Xenobia bacterium]|jgi:type II secretory pathway pseudopilin PulG